MKYLLKYSFIVCVCFIITNISNAQNTVLNVRQIEAIKYLDSIGEIAQSLYWPNVKPKLFLQNIRKNITKSQSIYSGTNTNFCSYAALTYSCINTYPVRYAHFMIALYKNGNADFREEHFDPSNEVKQAAGLLNFKGALDINHADQMWFMTLADYFKGYLNVFSLHYKPGAENKLWPATNFAKFNRMLRKLCNYQVQSKGTDLIRPNMDHLTTFLTTKLSENHQVFLYLNNAILHKSNHNKVSYRLPTHYVVLMGITENEEMINLTYWDYGFKTLLQLPFEVFKDILFGVTWCKKNMEE